MTLRDLLPTPQHARALAAYLLMPAIVLEPETAAQLAEDRPLLSSLLRELAEADRPLSELATVLAGMPSREAASGSGVDADTVSRLARLRRAVHAVLSDPLQSELAEAYIAQWQPTEAASLADFADDP
jgi:hypothetical protein